jgi:hypothetical protein
MSTQKIDHIGNYASTVEVLKQALTGLNEEQLTWKPSSESWSIKEVFFHLIDSTVVSTHRIHKVIAEEEAYLTDYDQDAWAVHLKYNQLPIEQGLAVFEALVNYNRTILEEIEKEAWQKKGEHQNGKVLSVENLVNNFVTHLDVHVRQIERIQKSKQFPVAIGSN